MADNAPTEPPAALSLRERRRQETAALILDSVLALMAEVGIDGLTMEARVFLRFVSLENAWCALRLPRRPGLPARGGKTACSTFSGSFASAHIAVEC